MPHLKLMGGLTLDPAVFTQPKPLLLLAYLALEGAQQRRRLAELFWPDGNRMKSLSMTLTRLRQGAGDAVEADDRRAWSTSSSDAGELLMALGEGAWERAYALYGGAFLDGVALDDWGSELEEWVHATREYLAERVQHGLLELAEASARRQDFAGAAAGARRAWRLPGAGAADPATLQRVFALLIAGGDGGATEVRRDLAEYGVDVDLSTEAARALWPAAAMVEPEGAEATAHRHGPGTESAPGAPSNLPPAVTSFVGRDDELRRIDAALAAPEGRLLTVTGPGGIGKSRLALEAARRLHGGGRYPDGVFLVASGALVDEASLPRRILESTGWPSAPGDEPWARLTAAAAPLRSLLVLDDVDGVAEAAPRLAALLEAAPGLALLLTARDRLGLAEERTLALPGLDVPDGTASWAEAMAGGAVRLVVERARELQAGLDLEPQLPGLLELCRALEGSPLALELAAPWTRLMPCADLLAQVASDPDFLASDDAGIPDRHRSLRAVFETSWAFLAPTERSVARRLAVFEGGCRRDAAAAVAGASLSAMGRLADAALLRGAPDGRYAVHPLVLAFLREKLAEVPSERDDAEARHAAFYLEWLAAQRGRLERGEQRRVFAALRDEGPNVEAIVRRALATRDVGALEPVLRLVDVGYEARGALREGVRLLEEVDALLRDDPTAAPLRARTLIDLGWLQHRLGGIEVGRALTVAGLELLGPDGDVALRARATMNLGTAEGVLGRREAAGPLLHRALDLARTCADDGLVASILDSLGIHESESGRTDRAALHFEEAAALHERGGRVLSAIRGTGNLAIAYGILGDLPRSGELMERSLALAREIDFQQSMPFTLSNLGVHHAQLGDHARARDLNLEARAVAEATGQRPILLGILVNLTEAHAALGDLTAALAASDDALVLSRDLAVAPLQLQALAARAALEAQRGHAAWAASLVQVVLAHPAAASYTGGGEDDLWRALEERLNGEATSAARAFGVATALPDALAWALAGGPPDAGGRPTA